MLCGLSKVYDALKESGMLDNTILIFTTDNGGAPNDFDSNQGSNYPFRGIKTNLFEGKFIHKGVNSQLTKYGMINRNTKF